MHEFLQHVGEQIFQLHVLLLFNISTESLPLEMPSQLRKVTGSKVQAVESVGQDNGKPELIGAILGFATCAQGALGKNGSVGAVYLQSSLRSSQLCAHV